MGRKLTPTEGAASLLSDTETNSEIDSITLSRSRSLLEQIAQQLGISPDEFSKASCPSESAVREHPPKDAFDPVLARERLDLLEAFTCIKDQQERLRCLQIVRDAAKGRSATDLRRALP
ncbi:hypothetical protein FV218_06525 [Methylobacterium sp. WL69]|uniref:hypothetical protein n=1 Tax=Methylobacterium sp. WL69 TaxID=2603893 RepID=UPI0011C88021|nr:hypothetical protein [Methylobacterium sp. WL69]TXM76596.1 hypothetical protein FV218_06525 [Methylobacterium sp. WL69]